MNESKTSEKKDEQLIERTHMSMLNANMRYLMARLTSERSLKRSRTLRCWITGVVLVVLPSSIIFTYTPLVINKADSVNKVVIKNQMLLLGL